MVPPASDQARGCFDTGVQVDVGNFGVQQPAESLDDAQDFDPGLVGTVDGPRDRGVQRGGVSARGQDTDALHDIPLPQDDVQPTSRRKMKAPRTLVQRAGDSWNLGRGERQARTREGPPSSSTVSPTAIFLRLRNSTSPLTRTCPSAIRALASPPLRVHPASLRTCVRLMGRSPTFSVSTIRTAFPFLLGFPGCDRVNRSAVHSS